MTRTSHRLLAATVALCLSACIPARADEPKPASAETVRWFQATEQALMNSIGLGQKDLWDRVMDPTCLTTSEEGELIDKRKFLEELRPLPPGLTGGITVQELTVQEFRDFAIVRFLADEWESVFGQKLATKYRVTDTFRRDGKDWKLVGSHFAVVTQDPPPQPASSATWPKLAGQYRLLPNGWTFTVELREGKLYGGRDPKKLRAFIPLTPDAFVLTGSLGEWMFVTDTKGQVTHILELRKFGPLVWTRVESTDAPSR